MESLQDLSQTALNGYAVDAANIIRLRTILRLPPNPIKPRRRQNRAGAE
jgi:hypothetical protein